MTDHPDLAQILALARAVTPELRHGVLEHLARCPECAGLLERSIGEVRAAESGRKILRFADRPPHRSVALPATLRVWWSRPRSSAWELSAAEPLLAELLDQPEKQRPLLVRNCGRFQDLALAELVLEEGRTFCFEDPHRGRRLIELGISIIDFLDFEYHGRRLLDELRGRGYGFRANAHRIVGEFALAEADFARAETLLAGGSCRLEQACLLQLKASLCKAQGRTPEALSLLTEAAEICEGEGEDTKAGRAYSGMGSALIDIGEFERAERALSEAVARIDLAEDPRTLLGVRHNLATCLAEQERYQEAAELMAELEPEYERFPETHMRLLRRWMEGKVLAGLGRDDEAERILVEVVDEYRRTGRPLAAADASIHLAMIYERQGRAAELRRLAEEMTSIYFSREIPRESAVALAFFVRAVEQERATRLVIERVAGFRKRARFDPDLRFSEYP